MLIDEALGRELQKLWHRFDAAPRPRRVSARALGASERQAVLDLLRSDCFVDLAPAEVYAALLDEGTYLCSIRTMYRILASQNEVRERRNQLRHPHYQKPELLALEPNEVWWGPPSGGTTISMS